MKFFFLVDFVAILLFKKEVGAIEPLQLLNTSKFY